MIRAVVPQRAASQAEQPARDEVPGAMIDTLGMQRGVWRSARPTTEKIVLLAIADFYSHRSPEPSRSVPTLAERCSLGWLRARNRARKPEFWGNANARARRLASNEPNTTPPHPSPLKNAHAVDAHVGATARRLHRLLDHFP